MSDELLRQDIQRWKPHVTIQNKVSAQLARQLQQSLGDGLAERGGAVLGLLIWKYLGGPWELADRIAFGTPPNRSRRSTTSSSGSYLNSAKPQSN
jgi:hypothetical protein